jgi:hypothetical protein
VKYGTFAHKDPDVCEFILHIGTEGVNDEHFKDRVAQMQQHGCTGEFINAYRAAAELGAVRVLFYV